MPFFEVTDPASGITLELEGDSAPTEQELEDIFSRYQPVEQQQAPAPQRGGGRSGLSRRKAQQAERTSELMAGIEAGQISSKDLTPVEVSRVQRARVDAIPEANVGSFRMLSSDVSFMSSLAAMTTFDPDEFGRILSRADPNIGIATTPEGERIALNNKTNEAVSINKLGPSMMDAAQLGISVAALAPAAALGGIVAPAVGAGLIQANIETGQALAGGEFDAEPIALAHGSHTWTKATPLFGP